MPKLGVPYEVVRPLLEIADRLLKPVGLIMWTTLYSEEEDDLGVPAGPLKVVGVSIGKRPNIRKLMFDSGISPSE